MPNELEHLARDATPRDNVRVARIAEHPGRAPVEDVAWLQLDYINDELPRVRMRAASRGGRI